MKAFIVLGALAFALGACATLPVGGAASTPDARIPEAPLDLGQWQSASASAAGQHFEREVAARYRAGIASGALGADLARSQFTCAAPRDDSGRGDPPELICRRTVSAAGCTHTWQVHAYEEPGRRVLARSRAIYDRRCGGDGLLGGPG
jgi:hypothetical protein